MTHTPILIMDCCAFSFSSSSSDTPLSPPLIAVVSVDPPKLEVRYCRSMSRKSKTESAVFVESEAVAGRNRNGEN